MYYAKCNVNLPRAMEAMKSPVKFRKTMIHRNPENKRLEGEISYSYLVQAQGIKHHLYADDSQCFHLRLCPPH